MLQECVLLGSSSANSRRCLASPNIALSCIEHQKSRKGSGDTSICYRVHFFARAGCANYIYEERLTIAQKGVKDGLYFPVKLEPLSCRSGKLMVQITAAANVSCCVEMAGHTGQSSQLFPVANDRDAQLLPTVAGLVRQVQVGCMPSLGRNRGVSTCVDDNRDSRHPCKHGCNVNYVCGNIVLEYSKGFEPTPEDTRINSEFIFDLSTTTN